MDSTDDELALLADIKAFSVNGRSASPPLNAPPILHSSPHPLGNIGLNPSEHGDESVFLEHPQRYSEAISPSGTIPNPRSAQGADLKEMENTEMAAAMTGQFSLAAIELHQAVDLPNELLLNILACLPWKDIVRCRSICRWIRDELDRSVRFQYQIALGSSSLKDRPKAGPLATADRLQLLVAQQQAWRNLECCKTVTFPVPFGSGRSSIYDFAGGMFGISTVGHSDLHYVKLPAAREVENGAGFEWSHVQLGFRLGDFIMDIEQDLLILMELPDDGQSIRFHFWTLSTHVTHPAASSPTLEHPSTSPGQGDFRVQIVGSHIGVIFRSSRFCEGGRLIIYSWTTGHTRAYVDAPPGDRLISFTFISPNTFIIPWKNALDLYSFDPTSTISPAPQSMPLVSFKLPDGRDPYCYFDCFGRSNHASDRSHLKLDAIGIPSFAPFSVDNEDGIITFWLKPAVHGLVFVVHRSTLLSYLNNWDASEEVRIVDWHAWGPQNTRWIDGYRHAFWMETVSGHRLAMVDPFPEDTAVAYISVLDFNPALVSRALTRSVASDLVTTRTLAGSRFFEEPIESELPFFETQSSDAFVCSVVVLDDHGLLVMQELLGQFKDALLFLPL